MSAQREFRTVPLLVDVQDAHTPLDAAADRERLRQTVNTLEAENASLRARLAAARFALTERRLTVLRCAAQGMTLAETARMLHVSVNTVKVRRTEVFQTLDARDITHAVHRAWEEGILP